AVGDLAGLELVVGVDDAVAARRVVADLDLRLGAGPAVVRGAVADALGVREAIDLTRPAGDPVAGLLLGAALLVAARLAGRAEHDARVRRGRSAGARGAAGGAAGRAAGGATGRAARGARGAAARARARQAAVGVVVGRARHGASTDDGHPER